jgi:hypothetical protein
MIWLLLVSALLIILLCYLLFAPFYLEVNSTTDLCRIRFHKLATAGVIVDEMEVIIYLKVLWWKKKIKAFAPVKRRTKSQTETGKKEMKMPFQKIWRMIKSFKVREFYLSIDTGNMQANGILYPLFYWLGNELKADFKINFMNENVFIIETENNVARILRAYIKS